MKIKINNYFKFVRKIPTIIWVFCALFGLFTAGILFGAFLSLSPIVPRPSEYEVLETGNRQYLELVRSYETLSDLYNIQGDNVDTILDKDTLFTNPEEAADAFSQMDDTRDLILIQFGKIDQLRKAAGLPEEDFQKAQ